MAAWSATPDKHTKGAPPPGAAVYWGGGAGHAAISAGNGMVYSTDVHGGIGLISIAAINQKWGKPYLGWSSQTNEKRISKFDAKPVRGKGTDPGSGPDTRTYTTQDNGANAGLAKNSQTADYGWADAVFKSNPELKKLLQTAKANNWDGSTMQAAIRGTDWYRKHSPSWREAWVLQRDNPAGFEEKRRQQRAGIDALAAEYGVTLTSQQRNKIAHDALWLGLDDNEIQAAVAGYFDQTKGDYAGKAGDLQDQIKEMASNYGVRVSDAYIGGVVQNILAGKATPQDAQNYITQLARSAYPALADQIDTGSTVKMAADPYIQSMSHLLEVSPDSIDIYDPTIRGALQHRTADGQNQLMPVYQFEEQVRKDPRWLLTDNGREASSGAAQQVLRKWGLLS